MNNHVLCVHYFSGVAFFPVVAPAAAVCGGGFFAGLGGFLYEKEAKNREDAMVDAEIMELQRRLNILKQASEIKN